MMVETVPDETGRLTADRDRLRKELNNLVESIALLGIGAATVGPKIKEREAELAKVEAKLRRPRPERPNADKVRAALLQRASEWRETLRAEPKVARLVLRRMIGSLTFSGAERPAFEASASGTASLHITNRRGRNGLVYSELSVKWDAPVKPGILEGIVPTDLVASSRGFGAASDVRSTSMPTGRPSRDDHSNERERSEMTSARVFKPVSIRGLVTPGSRYFEYATLPPTIV